MKKTSLNEAVKVIRKDPSLVMRIMKVANSARFGGTMQITALEIAAGRLGMAMLKQLAVVEGFSNLFNCKAGGYNSRQYWEHSLTCAFVSEEIDKKLPSHESTHEKMEFFTAALLHGVGLLILQSGFPELTQKVASELGKKEEQLTVIENSIMGISYDQCGEKLCTSWRLPKAISDTVRWHTNPHSCPEESRRLCELVYISKFIALHQQSQESFFTPATLPQHQDLLEKYQLTALSEADMQNMADNALTNALSIL